MTRLSVAGCLVLSLGLGGCSYLNTVWIKPLSEPRGISVLVSDYRAAQSVSGAEADRWLVERKQAYDADQSEMNRLRLAIALGFSSTPQADPQQALMLFDSEKEGRDDLRETGWLFAELLRARLSYQSQLDSLQGDLKSATLQRAELQEKLDALKSIERSLFKR